jgi:hypothetical protein
MRFFLEKKTFQELVVEDMEKQIIKLTRRLAMIKLHRQIKEVYC